MHIIISRKGTPVSLYHIEKFFQDNKDKKVINLSDETSLTRFRLGVKQGEIPPFKITVKDINKTLTTEICSHDGKLCKSWNTTILKTWEKLICELL